TLPDPPGDRQPLAVSNTVRHGGCVTKSRRPGPAVRESSYGSLRIDVSRKARPFRSSRHDARIEAPSAIGGMMMTDAIERVSLTHLQIPFKEPFRISGGEVAVKDAILVTVETPSAVGVGESAPMAASFGYSSDTPEGCWNDLAERIAPSLLGRRFSTPDDIASVSAT